MSTATLEATPHTYITATPDTPSEPDPAIQNGHEGTAIETASHRPGHVHNTTAYAVSSIRSYLSVRRDTISEKWDSLPVWRRGAYRIGSFVASAAGITLLLQGARMTGAAAHEVSSMADVFQSTDVPATLPETNPLPQTLITEAHLTDHHTLPADLNDAPAPKALGDYDGSTGDGTIWSQARDYADDLGYGKLTDNQLWKLTDTVLKENDLSWDEADGLSGSFKPQLPSQNAILDELQDIGAKPTHAADREIVIIPEPQEPSNTGPADVNNNGVPDSIESKPPAIPIPESIVPGDDPADPDKVPEQAEYLWNTPDTWFEEQWRDFIYRVRELGSLDYNAAPEDQLPAWWERNWARALGVASVLGVVYAYDRDRRSRRPSLPVHTPTTRPVPVMATSGGGDPLPATPVGGDAAGKPNASPATVSATATAKPHKTHRVRNMLLSTAAGMYIKNKLRKRDRNKTAQKTPIA